MKKNPAISAFAGMAELASSRGREAIGRGDPALCLMLEHSKVTAVWIATSLCDSQ